MPFGSACVKTNCDAWYFVVYKREISRKILASNISLCKSFPSSEFTIKFSV